MVSFLCTWPWSSSPTLWHWIASTLSEYWLQAAPCTHASCGAIRLVRVVNKCTANNLLNCGKGGGDSSCGTDLGDGGHSARGSHFSAAERERRDITQINLRRGGGL